MPPEHAPGAPAALGERVEAPGAHRH